MPHLSFDIVYARARWRAIPNCPGRYVLVSPADASFEVLLGNVHPVLVRHTPHADDVLVVHFSDGAGLLTFRKQTGHLVHTLNTPEGLRRRLERILP
jgi:hypothetical protein